MKHCFGILILIFVGFCLKAQDPHFSNGLLTPLYLNPASAGDFEGVFRSHISYRNQWFSVDDNLGFNTAELEVDYQLSSGKDNYWGIGLVMLSDIVGASLYRYNTAKLDLAYSLTLGKARFNTTPTSLSFAGELGFAQNAIGSADLWFGRQYDLGRFQIDRNLDSGEPLIDATTNSNGYADVGVGILFKSGFSKRNKLIVGLAGHHLNQPLIAFRGAFNEDRLPMKIGMHGQLFLPINQKIELRPRYILQIQQPFSQHILGSEVMVLSFDENEFGFGMMGRIVKGVNGISMDALILSSTIKVNNFTFGMSYDVTMSSFRQANNRHGAFELHINYIKPKFFR